jgi:hypothetical protein
LILQIPTDNITERDDYAGTWRRNITLAL